MLEENKRQLENIKSLLSKKIRIDIVPDTLDTYFLNLFLLYWIVTHPLGMRTGKAVIIDLLQAGLRAKFSRPDSLIKEKIDLYCKVNQITSEELLEAVREAIGKIGDEAATVTSEELEPGNRPFYLGEK